MILENHPKQPQGGHNYPLPGGSGVLRAKTLEELSVLLARYRVNNGLPHGDPWRDIELYYAKQYPWMIEGDLPDNPEPTHEENVWKWVNHLWANPPKTRVKVNVDGQRAAICRTCEQFTPLDEKPSELRRRILVLTNGSILVNGSCKLHGWHCDVAVKLNECSCERWKS